MSEEKNKVPKVGEEYEIPVEGSLGLFALGYRGVTAWRKVRKESLQKNKENTNEGFKENKEK